MAIRELESRQTRQVWGTGSGNPALMVLTCLVVNLVSLVVSIAINATVANREDNDLGRNTGWAILTPAPAAGLVWGCIDVAAGHFSVLHPIHYLVESTILMCLNISLGVPGVILYSWDDAGSWVPGMFMLITALVYITIMVISARVVHKGRKRPQSSGSA